MPEPTPRKLRQILPVAIALGVVAPAAVGALVLWLYSLVTWTVMKKASPNGQHTAKLVRTQGIDVNFRLSVDGHRIYVSPDFSPADREFRAQIAWNKLSNIVVFEVAGERLFSYHADEKRSLTDSELLAVEFASLRDLRYEGTIPREAVEQSSTGK